MAISGVITAQTGGRQFNAPNFTKYSQFLGGVNATHHALQNYSPLMNGFGRLFMVRPPYAIAKMFAGNDAELYSSDSLFMQFKHMTEYMLAGLTGFGEKSIQNAGTPITGGFAGRNFNTPTVTKDATESISMRLYELNGSPVYTVIDGWMNAIGDENSGLATYGGWIGGGADENNIQKRLFRTANQGDEGIEFNEANHTAEFIWLLHDRSGAQVERAVLLADVYPMSIAQAPVLDMTTGTHDNVVYDITFNCEVYRSPIITAIANDLLKQFRIVSNSLNFNPELGDAVYTSAGAISDKLGAVPSDSATGTGVGNIPVFGSTNAPDTRLTSLQDMDAAKRAGQESPNAVNRNWVDYLRGSSYQDLESVIAQYNAAQGEDGQRYRLVGV